MNGIIKKSDNEYYVEILLQDGSEDCGTFDTEEEAVERFFKAQKLFNNWSNEKCSIYKVAIYEWQPKTEYYLQKVKEVNYGRKYI